MNDTITIVNPKHEGKPVYTDPSMIEEYELIDGERHCMHVNHEIERACCSGFEGGLPSCGCGGMDAVGCPNPKCDGITDNEVEALLMPEEPDYDNYED